MPLRNALATAIANAFVDCELSRILEREFHMKP